MYSLGVKIFRSRQEKTDFRPMLLILSVLKDHFLKFPIHCGLIILKNKVKIRKVKILTGKKKHFQEKFEKLIEKLDKGGQSTSPHLLLLDVIDIKFLCEIVTCMSECLFSIFILISQPSDSYMDYTLITLLYTLLRTLNKCFSS